jgi:PRTRC genetic system protein C
MLTATRLKRCFSFQDKQRTIQLADPCASFSPEAVMNFYAQTYPILTTATIEGPEIRNDEIQFQFVSTIGTKG